MKNSKRFIATLLIIAIICVSIPVISAVSFDAEITAGVETIVYGDEEYTFRFVPEEDGCYVFESHSEDLDPYGCIMDSAGEIIAQNDDCNVEDYNFCTGYDLKKGEVYYLSCGIIGFGADENGYPVVVRKAPETTGVKLTPVLTNGTYPGDYVAFLMEATPEGAFAVAEQWWTEDESIAVIESEDGLSCAVMLVKPGTTTVNVEISNGLTASADVVCERPADILLDTIEEVTLTGETMYATFTFVPEKDGNYCFVADAIASIVLLDEDLSIIALGNIDYDEGISAAKSHLEKGKSYIVKTGIHVDSLETYSFTVKECPSPEAMDINYFGEPLLMVGTQNVLYVDMYPTLAMAESIEWYADSDICTLEPEGDVCGVVFTEAGTATVTARADNGITAEIIITCTEPEEIKVGETLTVTKSNPHTYSEDAVIQFIPEKSGYYVFMSGDNEELDTVGVISDVYGDIIALSDDYSSEDEGYSYHFVVQAYLEAGEVYYLSASSYNGEGEYTVTVVDCEPCETVSIWLRDPNATYVGTEICVNVDFGSKTAIKEEYEIVVENPELISIGGMSREEFYVVAEEACTTNIYIVTESGIVSEPIELNIRNVEYNALKLDERYEVSGPRGERVYFEFTPEESGTYYIMSDGQNIDPYFCYIDEYMSELDYDDDSGFEMNFFYVLDTVAGETYRFYTSCYEDASEGPGEYAVIVTQPKDPEGITLLPGDEIGVNVDDFFTFTLKIEPVGAIDTIERIEISDDSVVQLSYQSDEYIEFYAVGEGTATVTFVTESGLSASATINVYDGNEEPEINLGDVNGDGQINSIDSNLIKRFITGSYDDINFDNSDVNMDGKIDSRDSNLVKRRIIGQ